MNLQKSTLLKHIDEAIVTRTVVNALISAKKIKRVDGPRAEDAWVLR